MDTFVRTDKGYKITQPEGFVAIDKLGKADDLKLTEVTQMILNANRFKSSRLGTRSDKKVKNIVSRNIVG